MTLHSGNRRGKRAIIRRACFRYPVLKVLSGWCIRILQSPEYRTAGDRDAVLEAALPTADRRTLPARTKHPRPDRKVRRIGNPEERTGPSVVADLEVAGIAVKGERRRKTRHFRRGKQCGARFLAKRSDQEFHSQMSGCWNRSHQAVRINAWSPLEPRINMAKRDRFCSTPRFGTSAHSAPVSEWDSFMRDPPYGSILSFRVAGLHFSQSSGLTDHGSDMQDLIESKNQAELFEKLARYKCEPPLQIRVVVAGSQDLLAGLAARDLRSPCVLKKRRLQYRPV